MKQRDIHGWDVEMSQLWRRWLYASLAFRRGRL
jgi:hypothetical protein